MNDLEIRGLKDLIKEIIEDETDFKNKIDELEEDVRELQGQVSNPEEDEDIPDQEDEEQDEGLPEEEELEDNPRRQEYEQNMEKASQKESGTRITKEDMDKIQKTVPKKLKPSHGEENLDDENWDEES